MNRHLLSFTTTLIAFMLSTAACGGNKSPDGKPQEFAIALNKHSIWMQMGETTMLSALSSNHDDGRETTITYWLISGGDLVIISPSQDKGPLSTTTITPIMPGHARIYVEASNNSPSHSMSDRDCVFAASPAPAVCYITILPPTPAVPATDIACDLQDAMTFSVVASGSNSHEFTASVQPPNATFKDIFWSSDNYPVATVGTSTITPNLHTLYYSKPGTATIKPRDAYGIIEKTFTVTVLPPEGWVPVTDIVLDKDILVIPMGGKALLSAATVPADPSYKYIAFDLPDGRWNEVAYTDWEMGRNLPDGTIVLLPRKPGETTVTAKALDGSNIQKTCRVIVTP